MLRAKELKAEADEPLSSQHCKDILANKSMNLLAEMIDSSGYGDSQLPKDLGRGFDLLGPIPDSSGVLPKKASFASLSIPEVREVASDNQKCVWQTTKDSLRTVEDLEVSREVYKLTLAKKNAGWVKGRFTLNDLPSDAILTRRFGVIQSTWDSKKGSVKKIRPIDDFTESLANQASRPKTGCCEWWVAGRGSCSSVETHGQQRSVPSVAWNHTALSVGETSHAFPYSGSAGSVGAYYFSFTRFSRVLPHGILQSCMQCSNSRQHEHGDGRSGPKSGGWD